MIIERLPPNRKMEASTVLSSAFYDYKTIRNFINDNTSSYESKLKYLIEYLCEVTFLYDDYVIVVIDNDEIVAAALVQKPGKKIIPEQISDLDNFLRDKIGDEAFQRFDDYEDITDRYKPDYDHYYIDTIGVHPNQQGKGYGRFLLEKINELIEEDKTCNTVCLFTESPENVKFYEHNGYRIFAEADFDSQHTWCMIFQI
jgi:ribosomal protein S18 acetylase RimI-like enzyme